MGVVQRCPLEIPYLKRSHKKGRFRFVPLKSVRTSTDSNRFSTHTHYTWRILYSFYRAHKHYKESTYYNLRFCVSSIPPPWTSKWRRGRTSGSFNWTWFLQGYIRWVNLCINPFFTWSVGVKGLRNFGVETRSVCETICSTLVGLIRN